MLPKTVRPLHNLMLRHKGKCEAHALPFQIGVAHMSAQISLARLRRIAPLRPSAVQVILPDWVVPTIEEAIVFLLRMGARIGDWTHIGTRVRWPYRWIPESKAERLHPIARAELPELMEAVDSAPATERRPAQVIPGRSDAPA